MKIQEQRELHNRHPDLLSRMPDLRDAIGEGDKVTYTQWELYLAFHHDKDALIFDAQPAAPRSPRFAPTPADSVSQAAHRQRIEITGHHRGTFQDQGDVARKCIRSFLHWRVDPRVDPVEPLADDVAQARAQQKEIVKQLVVAIKQPDPRVVPASDPANTAAFIAATRAAAARWRVNLATIVDIAATYEEQVRAAISADPDPEALYDDAFANLALGDYTAACFSARRAADIALTSAQRQPENASTHREAALNALFLLHDAAKAAFNIPAATAALEEAAGLVDKKAEPLRWANVNQTLAKFLLDQAVWERSEELISEILDVREEHQGENHSAVGVTLLLWCSVLEARANYKGVESVAARAELIFASQIPPELQGVTAALGQRGLACASQSKFSEAEAIFNQEIGIAELAYGPDAQELTSPLGNLAEVLLSMNRLDEAEPLMRRVLAIDEERYGREHPKVAIDLNNLGSLLRARQQLAEAENLYLRAIAIDEKIHGSEHPAIAVPLKNLGELLLEAERFDQAEPIILRALVIDERSYGPTHPKIAISLNNLAYVLMANERWEEAEQVIRTSIAIVESNYGIDHPILAHPLGTLAVLLRDTNRLTEADETMRRVLVLQTPSL